MDHCDMVVAIACKVSHNLSPYNPPRARQLIRQSCLCLVIQILKYWQHSSQ